MSEATSGIKLMPWGEVPPGAHGHWTTGRLVSIAGCPVGAVFPEDVAAVVYHYADEDGWDGKEVCVLRLKDGRFVAYETFWGPTGHGFSEDAYGGGADLVFGWSLGDVVLEALTDEGRRLVGIPEEGLR